MRTSLYLLALLVAYTAADLNDCVFKRDDGAVLDMSPIKLAKDFTLADFQPIGDVRLS